MLLAEQLDHQRLTHPGPFVLGTNSLKSPAPTVDKDRTVSRRSEPSSRTTLIGEQPNPWDLLQPQDVMSRHLPCGTTGSLSPGFPSVRNVSLTVKHTYAFAL